MHSKIYKSPCEDKLRIGVVFRHHYLANPAGPTSPQPIRCENRLVFPAERRLLTYFPAQTRTWIAGRLNKLED
jgi:hypothetical protein